MSYLRRAFVDLAPTQDELDAARTAEAAPTQDASVGSGIGTALGALLGGAAGVGLSGLAAAPTAGASLAISPALVTGLAGAGAAAGGGIGNAIGGMVGSQQAKDAEKVVDAAQLKRQQAITDEELRQQAMDQFLSER